MTRSLSELAHAAEQRARAFRRAMRRIERRCYRLPNRPGEVGKYAMADFFRSVRIGRIEASARLATDWKDWAANLRRDPSMRPYAFLYERAADAIMRSGTAALLDTARRA